MSYNGDLAHLVLLYLPTMSNAAAEQLHDKHLRLWGIPFSVTCLLLAQMPFYYPGRWDLYWRYLFIGILYTGLLWEIARFFFIRIRRRYPSLDQTWARIGNTLWIMVILVAIGQVVILEIVMLFGWESPTWVSPWHTWRNNFISSLFFVVLLCGAYEANYFFRQYRSALQKTEQLKKQHTQQKLDALKTRINPHFLFNSLTSLSALIGEDPARAEHFVDELSKVYRYMLRSGQQTSASLAEELQFAHAYVFLLQTRFEAGAFSWSNLWKENPGQVGWHLWNVPALTLQNALDYLVRTQNTPLHIQLEAREGHLHISCPDHGKSRAFNSISSDWEQLEGYGATQRVQEGRFEIIVPLTPLHEHS